MSQSPARIIVPIPSDLLVRDREMLRWGTVTTIRAPLRDIARFAAYHLDLGAAEVNIFLDVPDRKTEDFFTPYPQVRITQCTSEYWNGKPEKARSSHQLRQAFNASRCYRRTGVDWLAHIDVDEFILAPGGLTPLLADTPPEAAFALLRPAELLAQPDPFSGLALFKLTRQELGLKKADIVDFYPEFGAFVPDGMISYTSGKIIARTGLPDIRLGLHALVQKTAHISNGHTLSEAHIGHAHAPSWEVFRRHMDFRMEKGSYRRKPHESMKLGDVLDVIHIEEGEVGLRRFYDELCVAGPRLLANLEAHGLLLTGVLDLDEKARYWFGELPARGDLT